MVWLVSKVLLMEALLMKVRSLKFKMIYLRLKAMKIFLDLINKNNNISEMKNLTKKIKIGLLHSSVQNIVRRKMLLSENLILNVCYIFMVY
jgi:hypothetical protein